MYVLYYVYTISKMTIPKNSAKFQKVFIINNKN